MSTVLAALIGAFFGSIGTAVVQEWLRSRRERDEHREALVRRYLFQLQDAVEALWHRVYNVRHEGGRGAMTASYQASTTVYALGRVLAAERILTLERARTAVGGLGEDPTTMDGWLDLLGRIAHLTSAATGIPTSIAEKEQTLQGR